MLGSIPIFPDIVTGENRLVFRYSAAAALSRLICTEPINKAVTQPVQCRLGRTEPGSEDSACGAEGDRGVARALKG